MGRKPAPKIEAGLPLLGAAKKREHREVLDAPWIETDYGSGDDFRFFPQGHLPAEFNFALPVDVKKGGQVLS